MLAKLTTKNQITLPRDVVKDFKGIEYFDAVVQDGRIVLEPVRIRPVAADLAGIRKKMERLGVTKADVTEAVRWSRKNTG
ncbi:MAG: AbrB/MazE/SpoVT family DNA-binding domain-containing protein [Deltaproteobacteria bacterium]|nr:AbrB/MazE/SpoVT family DNA-binding domain-containing protein [Deltaproteobacteria bacterium]